jgi:protein-S-isoprenylcysteine O-methyltransferase Ste14
MNKRVLPPMYLYGAIVLIFLMHFLFPIAMVIPAPWHFLGILPFALGSALNLLADHGFKISGTTVKPFETSTALLTGGVYKISRHPMYLGFILILLGIALFLRSLSPYIVVGVFAILMELVFIRVEEAMLEDTFGEAWTVYKRGVRRWI